LRLALAISAFVGLTRFAIVIAIHSAAYDAKMDIQIYPDFVGRYPDAKIKQFSHP